MRHDVDQPRRRGPRSGTGHPRAASWGRWCRPSRRQWRRRHRLLCRDASRLPGQGRSSAPVPPRASRPLSGPRPDTRFWRATSPPGIGTCVLLDSVSTVVSGVLLDGRPRMAMSMYVTAFSAVVPAAPAAAPHSASRTSHSFIATSTSNRVACSLSGTRPSATSHGMPCGRCGIGSCPTRTQDPPARQAPGRWSARRRRSNLGLLHRNELVPLRALGHRALTAARRCRVRLASHPRGGRQRRELELRARLDHGRTTVAVVRTEESSLTSRYCPRRAGRHRREPRGERPTEQKAGYTGAGVAGTTSAPPGRASTDDGQSAGEHEHQAQDHNDSVALGDDEGQERACQCQSAEVVALEPPQRGAAVVPGTAHEATVSPGSMPPVRRPEADLPT